MSQDLKCFFGLHKFEVLKEEAVKHPYGTVVGTVVISRCKNCGKIKSKTIYTDTNNLR